MKAKQGIARNNPETVGEMTNKQTSCLNADILTVIKNQCHIFPTAGVREAESNCDVGE